MSYFSSLFFQNISLFLIGSKPPANSSYIDLVTVLDVMLTSRQTREKLQCLYENLISNNFDMRFTKIFYTKIFKFFKFLYEI